jgi:hypothetical protein
MTAAEVVVTLLGVGAIGWVNWYFFMARNSKDVNGKR